MHVSHKRLHILCSITPRLYYYVSSTYCWHFSNQNQQDSRSHILKSSISWTHNLVIKMSFVKTLNACKFWDIISFAWIFEFKIRKEGKLSKLLAISKINSWLMFCEISFVIWNMKYLYNTRTHEHHNTKWMNEVNENNKVWKNIV